MTLIIKQMRKLIRYLIQILVCIKNQYLQHKQIKERERERLRLSQVRRKLHLQTPGEVLGTNNYDRKIKK
jgi:hypothetical protein